MNKETVISSFSCNFKTECTLYARCHIQLYRSILTLTLVMKQPPQQTFVFNSVILSGLELNCTVSDDQTFTFTKNLIDLPLIQ